MRKTVNSEKAAAPIGPYNQAVIANGFLFVSGQIPIETKSGNIIKGDIEAATECIMKNLKSILSEAGLNFNNVVKTTIFLTDLNNFEIINKVYGSYFEKDFPARETVQVSALPRGAEVEISLIAVCN
jgi:2-iminobutanoate/2-iminopropanoate deaminase